MRENQKAKETVAGLIERNQLARDEIARHSEAQRQGQMSVDPKDTRGTGRGNAASDPASRDAELRAELSGKGKGTVVKGKPGKGDGGEFLYVQSRLPNGAARAPYSNVYPQ